MAWKGVGRNGLSDNKRHMFSPWPWEGGLVLNSISNICQQWKQQLIFTECLVMRDVHIMILFNLHTNSIR